MYKSLKIWGGLKPPKPPWCLHPCQVRLMSSQHIPQHLPSPAHLYSSTDFSTINLAMHIPTYQPNSSHPSLSQQSCINCILFSMNIYIYIYLLSLQIWTPMMSMAHFENAMDGGVGDLTTTFSWYSLLVLALLTLGAHARGLQYLLMLTLGAHARELQYLLTIGAHAQRGLL